jgi:hypothetical protein
MSKTFNTTTKTKTPYCKVCHDAGRPESEYTSHYVKDQPGTDGKVVCPTLLNQACRICHQKGHTSTYCSRYRPRQPAEERPRDERPRYIEREERPRRESDRRDISFNRLRDDTDRHERDIRSRDDAYNREQDRRSKPWLQAALSTTTTHPRERRGPYAHPHGPRVRLELESRALSSSAVAAPAAAAAAVDVMKADLHHATNWCDEEPEKMADEMFQELARENRSSSSRHDDDYISKEDDDLITMSLGGGHIQFAGYD